MSWTRTNLKRATLRHHIHPHPLSVFPDAVSVYRVIAPVGFHTYRRTDESWLLADWTGYQLPGNGLRPCCGAGCNPLTGLHHIAASIKFACRQIRIELTSGPWNCPTLLPARLMVLTRITFLTGSGESGKVVSSKRPAFPRSKPQALDPDSAWTINLTLVALDSNQVSLPDQYGFEPFEGATLQAHTATSINFTPY